MKVSDLYKVDMLAFNSKIGYVTNLGTTLYEMQSQYDVGSLEYEEINNRLKLLCCSQSQNVDGAKGIKIRPLPKHWTQYQKIEEKDSEEEKARKKFENKLVIKKRPEFMRYLYSSYNKEYKDFCSDFDKYSSCMFGKKVADLTAAERESELGREMIDYYDKKNPLLETNGVMNRLSRYMQESLKGIKSMSNFKNEEIIFEKIYNKKIFLDLNLLSLMKDKYYEYCEFKRSKQLQNSDFSTYEQYYKNLRNECLEKISSDLQELANLAVYVCYKLFPKKPKDFCWDVFGVGIVQNLEEGKEKVSVPCLCADGEIEYLGERYKMMPVDLKKRIQDSIVQENSLKELDDLISEMDELFEDFD